MFMAPAGLMEIQIPYDREQTERKLLSVRSQGKGSSISQRFQDSKSVILGSCTDEIKTNEKKNQLCM